MQVRAVVTPRVAVATTPRRTCRRRCACVTPRAAQAEGQAGAEVSRRLALVAATAATTLALKPPPAVAEETAAAEAPAPPAPPPPPPPPVVDPPITQTAYLDLAVGGKPAGRLEIGLWGSVLPRSVANFLALAGSPIEGEGRASKLVGRYKGSSFHRLVPGFVLQGGE